MKIDSDMCKIMTRCNYKAIQKYNVTFSRRNFINHSQWIQDRNKRLNGILDCLHLINFSFTFIKSINDPF